jgi:acyl dehydratase
VTATQIEGLAGLEARVGSEIGVSNWIDVDQPMIDAFAETTGDRQWIHIDVERCKRESPFGGTIAHGFLILSLGPRLAYDVVAIGSVKMGINYGLDRLRFTSPLRSGSKLRLRVVLAGVDGKPDGSVLVRWTWTFETEGQDRPVAVAEMLSKVYF